MNAFNLLAAFSVAATLLTSPAHAADPYPSRPITVVVPFAAGGAVDIMGRTMGEILSKALSQPFIVENRPGGGGSIASNVVAKAAPDGYTLFVGSAGPMTVAPALFPSAKLDPLAQFEPVIWFANTPGIVVARNGIHAHSMKELIALSKASPGRITMASGGSGSILHLMGEYLQERLGFKWTHVPYKGSTPALADMIAGQVDVMVDVVPTAAPHVQSKSLTAFAVTTAKRSSQLPEVPTLEELGFPGFDMGSWMALMAPKGTPDEIVAKLNRILNDALKTPALRARLQSMGAEPEGGSPERVTERLREEIPRWAKIVKSAGLGN
jgi:tripartite-type tricarboxylate transporter receptor subunit TctC